MEDFMFIASIISSVLGVILFFKVWGMTNDVADIARYLHSKKDNSDAIRVQNLISKGKKAEAEKALEEVAEKLSSDIMSQRLSVKEAKEKFEALEAQYKSMGKTMPNYIASIKEML